MRADAMTFNSHSRFFSVRSLVGVLSTFGLGVVVATATSCARMEPDAMPVRAAPRTTIAADEVVAHVSGAPIVGDRLREAMVRQGGDAVGTYDELSEKRRILETVVREEVLAAEARREHFDQEPEVAAAINRMLAERYWEQRVWGMEFADPTDSDIQAYYDGHADEYRSPARVRGSTIFFAWREDASADERRVVGEHAAQVLDEVRSAKKSFAQLAADESDDVLGRQRGGDIGWLPVGAAASYPAPEAVRALYGLEQVGAVSEPVESARGIYLVKLTDRLPASTQPFEQVRDSIRAKLTVERRAGVADERYQEIRDRYAVEVHDDVLAQIGPPAAKVAGGPPSFPVGPGSKSP